MKPGASEFQVSRLRRTLACPGVAGAAMAFAATVSLAAGSTWLNRVPPKDHARNNPLVNQPQAIHAGALLYQEHCQQCHKENGEGDRKKKPSLKTERIRNASDGDLEWFLRQGNLAHGMPSWSSLPEGQRWQLIAYLRSLQ